MSHRGFTLIEAIVATGILCVAVLGGVHVATLMIDAMRVARAQNITVTLASARMEELRGLQYEFDELGVARTDTVTNLAHDPRTADGSGLLWPAGSLSANTSGFTDYLDSAGRWVGEGTTVPADAAFVRRWAVSPCTTAPDALVIQVVVFPAADTSETRSRGAASLVSVLARRQQ